jgi:hypothetical protein
MMVRRTVARRRLRLVANMRAIVAGRRCGKDRWIAAQTGEVFLQERLWKLRKM